ncbi:MAG TPA: Gfo/Idh/MocA family oxidoreductase [Acidobacteriaceae bacterium]|nr:Gfo/Idh/MocA family oxidoreductase [Acidobacteriaceae bacterium]
MPAALSADPQASLPADVETARQTAINNEKSPVRLGIIGAGSRGKELVRSFLRTPGVRIAAAADVYPPRFAEVDEVCGYEVPRHADHRHLLERKDLDAVVIATPLGLHGEHVLDSIAAGHHVYGEKVLAYTLAEAKQIVDATEQQKRIFQIGHQYRYSPWIRAAVARVQRGEIGEVTLIQGYWHRNSDWRRPVPDPSLERLINWRLYNQWSLGLIAELGSHHIDLANWVFGATPVTALGSGSICRYHDGRETDDNAQAILTYPGGRHFVFTSVTDNAKMGDQIWFYGSKGSLNITLQDATFFYEPKKIERIARDAKGVITTASYNPSNEMPYRGAGSPVQVTNEDPTTAATRAFIYCVRHNVDPIANVHVGYNSAIGVIHACESRKTHAEVTITV